VKPVLSAAMMLRNVSWQAVFVVCVGKIGQRAAWIITAVHAVLRGLIRGTVGEAHRLNLHEQFSLLPRYTSI
jgi:hypothetical protein